jgi:Flagellar hook-length control protein FliK
MGLSEQSPPQGTQFEADPLTSNSDPETFPWKVRIAVDLEETGPVQAEIALRGQSIAVTLWAERHATAGIARREISALHQALSQASFDVTRLEVKDGRPSGSTKTANPVLDRRT